MTDTTPPMPEPQDIAALREAAEAATPGPWDVWHALDDGGVEVYVPNGTMDTECIFEFKDHLDCEECARPSAADVEFIAATSPDVVLALLSEVERGRALRAAVEALAEEWEAVAAVARKDITLSRAAHRIQAALLAAHVPSPLPVGGAAGAGEVGTP